MERFHHPNGIVSCYPCRPLSGPELNEGVDVVDYVQHAVGRGRFRDFQFFESVDSPWVILEV